MGLRRYALVASEQPEAFIHRRGTWWVDAQTDRPLAEARLRDRAHTLYHATDPDNVLSICRRGLLPSCLTGRCQFPFSGLSRGNLVYLHEDADKAMMFLASLDPGVCAVDRDELMEHWEGRPCHLFVDPFYTVEDEGSFASNCGIPPELLRCGSRADFERGELTRCSINRQG